MSANKLFGKDIIITSTTNASGTSIGSISTLGGVNINQTALISGALTSIANSNTIGNLFTTGGNVGLGTTSPVQRLDVNGNLNITGNFYQNGSVYSGSTQWGSTGANIYFNTGNVGIGTLAPTAKLQVEGEVNLNIMSGFNTSGLITLGRSDGFNRSSAIKVYNSTGGNSYMSFEIHNGTTGSRTTAMLMDGFGNVGIGTTSPDSALHVSGTIDATPIGNGVHMGTDSVNNASIIQINQGGTTSGSSIIDFGYSNTNFVSRIIHDNGTKNLGFRINSTQSDVLTLASSGNIGIGTTSPTSRLHLANPSTQNTNNMVFEVGTTADGTNAGWSAINWNGYFNGGETRINTGKNRWRLFVDQRSAGDNLVFDTYNGTTLTTIMTLTTNGNVGIGPGNPAYPLTVSSPATQGTISIRSNDARYHLYNNAAVAEWLFGQKSSSRSDFTFSKVISGSESDYLTITTSGNVGVGTTSPGYKLDIRNHTNATDAYGLRISTSTGTSGLARTYGLWVDATGSDDGNYAAIFNTGNVGIGANAPGRKLQVEGLVQIGDGAVDNGDNYGALNITQNDTAIGSRAQLALIRAGNAVAYFRLNTSNQLVIQVQNGGVYLGNGATAWTANSDRTLKTNFQDIPNPLDKISQIKGTFYKFKTDSEDVPRRVGVIAQDVQAVLPEIVTTNNEGKLGVSYSELIPLLIEAIKELKKEFTEYKESHP